MTTYGLAALGRKLRAEEKPPKQTKRVPKPPPSKEEQGEKRGGKGDEPVKRGLAKSDGRGNPGGEKPPRAAAAASSEPSDPPQALGEVQLDPNEKP